MIRFSSSIRFITRAEWLQQKLNTMPNVMSWDMHMPDQFVPREQSTTCGISPCLGGGLTSTGVNPNTGSNEGQVAMMHLIPVYHRTAQERKAVVRYLKSSADTLYQDSARLFTTGKRRLKGLYLGTNGGSDAGLWATVCHGVNAALKAPEWQSLSTYAGLSSPFPTASVSAFIGQSLEALSHIAYDGTKDTWYVVASILDKPNKQWYVARSASTIKQIFKHRYIASDDQVYVGATETQPLSRDNLHGHGRTPFNKQDVGWVHEPMVNRSGMHDLDDTVMMTSTGSAGGVKVLPKDQRDQRDSQI